MFKRVDLIASLAFAALRVGADTNITENLTLDADLDLREHGAVTVAAGVTVDLNGHNLTVAGLSGGGTITNSAFFAPAVTPSVIASQAMFWLDARDTSTLTVDGDGKVTEWRSKVGSKSATVQQTDVAPLYSADGFQLPCVDFGSYGSKQSLSYDRFENIRTVFAVMKLQKSLYVALLTDRSVYDFYRGSGGQYLNREFSSANASHIWNGTQEVDPANDVIPDDSFQVLCYEMKNNARSDTLAMDRPNQPKQGSYNGGKQISELILFNSILSEDDRKAVTAYLKQKWMPLPSEIHFDLSREGAADFDGKSLTVSEGVAVVLDDAQMESSCDLFGFGPVRVDGTVDLNNHDLYVDGLSGEGTLTSLANPEPLAAPAIISSEAMFWLDAADTSTLTMDGDKKVSAWRSKVGSRVATLKDSDVAPVYSDLGFVQPCVDFGSYGSKQSLSYDRFVNIRTVFAVMKLQKSGYVAPLTDRDAYDFYRGSDGQYLNREFSSANASHIWNGTQEVDPANDVIPDEDFQVLCYEMKIDAHSDTLAMDRPGIGWKQESYNGGKQISELILFDSVLSESDRRAVVTYLRDKWSAYRAAGASLHWKVPAGESAMLDVALSGRIQLVKEGEGTLVARRHDQSYTCGTRIAAGTATVPVSGSTGGTYALKYHQYGPQGSEIVIEPGATFDTKGNYDACHLNFVLAGGKLVNTGCNQSKYTANWACGGNVELTSNSQYCVTYWTAHKQGFFDLGGNELEVATTTSDGILIFYTTAPCNGTLKTSGQGHLQFESGSTRDMRTVDLVLGTPIKVMDADVNVRNLTTVDYAGAGAFPDASRQKHVNIYGIYKPITDYVQHFTLQNGATIDLSARSTPFDVRGKSFEFASDAQTIYVDAGDLPASSQVPIVAWSEKPENVRFVSADGVCGFVAKDDGLYLLRGLMIIIR